MELLGIDLDHALFVVEVATVLALLVDGVHGPVKNEAGQIDDRVQRVHLLVGYCGSDGLLKLSLDASALVLDYVIDVFGDDHEHAPAVEADLLYPQDHVSGMFHHFHGHSKLVLRVDDLSEQSLLTNVFIVSRDFPLHVLQNKDL